MQDIFQKKFNELVSDILNATPGVINNDDFGKYQSVVSMIYTLIEDGKLNELDTVLKIHFPQYYYDIARPILTHPN